MPSRPRLVQILQCVLLSLKWNFLPRQFPCDHGSCCKVPSQVSAWDQSKQPQACRKHRQVPRRRISSMLNGKQIEARIEAKIDLFCWIDASQGKIVPLPRNQGHRHKGLFRSCVHHFFHFEKETFNAQVSSKRCGVFLGLGCCPWQEDCLVYDTGANQNSGRIKRSRDRNAHRDKHRTPADVFLSF